MAAPKKETKTTKGSQSQIAPTRTISKKLSEDELLNTMGATGTYIVNGFLEQDYNANLSGVQGLEKYDEMRRSDSKVRQSLMVCILPILSTEWYVEPAQDKELGEVGEAEQEVADFVETALFEKMETTWQQHLTEVLTCLPFGFSLFEKTYFADDFDGHIYLKNLGSRKQTTIDKWETEDGRPGITQQLSSIISDPENPNFGKSTVSIPSGKMLLFTFQKEGDNYAGVSVLRSAYKHWYIKDALYKFDSIKHERQGVGVPVIELPKGHTEKDKLEAKMILKNIRSNEQGGVLLPAGWKFYFADLQASNTSDIWKSIEHHNAEIANNVLAMFLNLVSGDGGSRALSEDQSDFFLLSLEALANMIEDVYNRFLIPELVDFNYDVQTYPKIRHKKLGSVDYSSMANVISTFVSSGVINPDEDLEDFSRKLIDAPPRMPEPEVEVDEDGNEIDPETGLPIEPIDDGLDPLTGLPLEEDVDDVIDDELIEASEIVEIDGAIYFSHEEGVWYECFREYSGFDGKQFSEETTSFRTVSEETKRKISEALKKALPGDTEQTKMRLKNEAAARKAQRHQKALQNARARLQKRKGGGIAKNRAARLKKAGVKDTKALQNKNKSAIKDVLSPAVPKKKKSKISTALKNISMRNKMKKPKKAKKAKKVKAPKAPKAVKKTVTKAPSRAAQQAKDKNSPLYKKPVAKTKAPSALQKAVAGRKAVRVASKKKVKASYDEYASMFNEGARHVLSIQKDVRFEKGDLPKRQFFAEMYEAWRPLTFAEQKVNWKSLKKSVSKFQTLLDTEVNQVLADQKADLLSQVKRAVDANDIAAVGAIKAKFTGDLSSAIANVQKEMFELGKSSVALEMGVKAPGTAKEIAGAIKVTTDKMVGKLTTDMENAASQTVAELVSKQAGSISNTGTANAVNAASEAIDKVMESKAAINTLSLYGSLNLGRATIYERYPEKVYAFQFSAIIDDRTTDTCLSLDGRVIPAGSADFYAYNPPIHYNCRSIFVEILQDEEFKPDTGEIPSRIPAGKTIDLFEDLVAPIVEPDSQAIKIIKQEIADRQAKIKEYTDAELYPNRVATHQARVDSLLSSLEDLPLGSIDISEEERVAKGGK